MPMFTKQCDDIKRDYHHYRYSYDPSYEHSQHKDSSTPKAWHRDSYDDLFRQFERLQMKAESIAEKDPIFAIRLENLAKQFADGRRSRAQRTNNQAFKHSTTPTPPPPPPPPPQQHPKFTTYQGQPSFHRSHVPTPPPSSHKPPNPKQPPFYPSSNSFAYNHARHNGHQQRSSRHNHSKHGNQSEYMYVLEENKPRKITVQMSRMQLGPNGEKQRVIVERDFNNDDELNAFLAEFEENISKVTAKEQNSKTGFFDHDNINETYKSPGVMVVEEPGEEPRLYRQDTGELVTDADGIFHGSAGFDPAQFNSSTNGKPNSMGKNRHQNYHRKYYTPPPQAAAPTPPPASTPAPTPTPMNPTLSSAKTRQNLNDESDKKPNHDQSCPSVDETQTATQKTDNTDTDTKTKVKNGINKKKVELVESPSDNTDTSSLASDSSSKKNDKTNGDKTESSSSEERKQKPVGSKKQNYDQPPPTPNGTSCPTPLPPQPSQFTSRVGYKQNERTNFFRNKSNVFMHPQVHYQHQHYQQVPYQYYAGAQVLHQPSPIPQPHLHQPPPPVPPMHHVQFPTYINEYGHLNFLNNRYGYQENPKQRSESRLLNTGRTIDTPVNVPIDENTVRDNTAKKNDKKQQQPSQDRRCKFAHDVHARSSRPPIYSNFRNMNNCNNIQRPRRLDRVFSYSSVSKATQKNALKRDLSKLYRKNPGLYFQNLKSYNKSATVVHNNLSGVRRMHKEGNFSNAQQPSQSFIKQQDKTTFNSSNNNNSKTIPTFFQPGFYPCERQPFQTNNHIPVKIYF